MDIFDPWASGRHIGRLRRCCTEEGLDGLLVRDTSNIQWLTAFDDVFDDEAAHAMYVDETRAVLHTDSRYSTACEQAAGGNGILVNSKRESHAAFAESLWAHRLLPEKRDLLGIEDSITLAEYRRLQKAFRGDGGESCEGAPAECGSAPSPVLPEGDGSPLPFRETDGLVVGLRAVKDPYEIARMRRAQAITDAAFAHICSFIKPGLTEREVQLELEDFMLRHGASGLAFSSIVASGANGASPHAIPGQDVLEAGQCVVLDFGARAFGYCSDMTRTVFLGQPSQQMEAAYGAIRRANEEVEALLRPGVTGKEAHQLAEDILAECGFAGKMGHGLGHGVGIDIHEEPVLSTRNEKPLVAGNVVTVEPGIYLPGQFGMRLEDFGVVAESGLDVFTESTHDMVVL